MISSSKLPLLPLPVYVVLPTISNTFSDYFSPSSFSLQTRLLSLEFLYLWYSAFSDILLNFSFIFFKICLELFFFLLELFLNLFFSFFKSVFLIFDFLFNPFFFKFLLNIFFSGKLKLKYNHFMICLLDIVVVTYITFVWTIFLYFVFVYLCISLF